MKAPEGPPAKPREADQQFLALLGSRAGVWSHEVRGALSRIHGYVDLLRSGGFGSVSAEQAEALNRVFADADDLVWSLTAIFETSRFDAVGATLTPVPFPLRLLLEEVQPYLGSTEGSVRWHLPEELPSLVTDRGKLKVLLANLARVILRQPHATSVTISARPNPSGSGMEILFCNGANSGSQVTGGMEESHWRFIREESDGICLMLADRIAGFLGGALRCRTSEAGPASFLLELPTPSSLD